MPEAESRSWQQQVANLTAERHRAESAVAVIKRLGGPGDLTAAEIAYGDGRAEIEAEIGARGIALDQGKSADPLAHVEARLARADVARETLARRALELAARTEFALIDLLAQGALTGFPRGSAAIGAAEMTGRPPPVPPFATRLESARWPPSPKLSRNE